jgi:gluconokinase
MVLIVMGVTGTGKTTIGKALAAELGWNFIEGDDFHPVANVEKMRAGNPLNDEDRGPWLEALRKRVDDACEREENIVLACSALKHKYREYLERHYLDCIHFIYLHGTEELLRRRLTERKGHFMDPNLLKSQLETLEPPDRAIQVDVAPPPNVIVAEIRRQLGI